MAASGCRRWTRGAAAPIFHVKDKVPTYAELGLDKRVGPEPPSDVPPPSDGDAPPPEPEIEIEVQRAGELGDVFQHPAARGAGEFEADMFDGATFGAFGRHGSLRVRARPGGREGLQAASRDGARRPGHPAQVHAPAPHVLRRGTARHTACQTLDVASPCSGNVRD